MQTSKQFAYVILTHMKGRLFREPSVRTYAELRTSGGYTIVEVMIVLAVSGALFISVVAMFSGRIASSQFRQAINTYETDVQDTISDTANGFYDSENVSCSVNGGGNYVISSGASTPGTNRGCVFAGKFLIPVMNSGVIKETVVTTLVGKQFRSGGTIAASSIAESEPEVLPASVGAKQVDISYVHEWEMRIERIRSLGPGNPNLDAFGFLSPVSGGVQEVTTTSSSGVVLYGHFGTVGVSSRDAIANQISSFTNFAPLPDGLVICISDAGNTDRTAAMRIGENKSQTGIVTTVATQATGDPLCV